MMQLVTKWKVIVRFDRYREFVFWMNDNNAINVLRQVLSLQFTESGLEQPIAILIEVATSLNDHERFYGAVPPVESATATAEA